VQTFESFLYNYRATTYIIIYTFILCYAEQFDYPRRQTGQSVTIPAGPSTEISVNLIVDDDSIRECNETFTLELDTRDPSLLDIDPGRNQATVTIIDTDGLFYVTASMYFI